MKKKKENEMKYKKIHMIIYNSRVNNRNEETTSVFVTAGDVFKGF